MLSYGVKEVMINSVLQSVPIHFLSAIVPPNCVIQELHKIFAKLFWSNKVDGRSKHWASWDKVCLPKHEGGLGFKSMFYVSQAMNAKLWWRFKTQNTLWANYMWTKYCKKHIPSLVQWRAGSQQWKHMLKNRECLEQHIWWEPKGGSESIWYDNWTRLGPLFNQQPDIVAFYPLTRIKLFMKEDG